MSGKGLPQVYWDTGVFLAHLKGEEKDAGSMGGMQEWIHRVETGKGVIMTSTITIVEVLQARLSETVKREYVRLFNSPYLQRIACDERVAKRASEIRSHYTQVSARDGGKTLSTPDAIHLATAILYKAAEFHTFDGEGGEDSEKKRTRLLLPLSGNVGGYSLVVCRPRAEQLRLRTT